MTVALVTGVAGQDGFYLAHLLRDRGVEVWGTTRDGRQPPDLPFVRLAPPAELRDVAAVRAAVAVAGPDQVYHLAAQTSVARSWQDPLATAGDTALGTATLLEAVRQEAPAARVFLAASSEVFGEPESSPQDETTPIRPVSPYGAAKAYGLHLARSYRERLGLFVAAGILYNHESPRRPPDYVTRKITRGARAIADGDPGPLRLGNLDAIRDWGFAGDTVRAMAAMLDHDRPSDFVVATGEPHTVRELCDLAFARVGLDYRDHVVVEPAFWRPVEPVPLVGDATNARSRLGWATSVDFAALVALMVDAESGSGDRPAIPG